MPGAEILIARYHESAAGRDAGRTPTITPACERPARKHAPDHTTDYTSGLRAACETLTTDLRVYVDERMVTT